MYKPGILIRIRLDPDPILKLWSDTDPVFKTWSDLIWIWSSRLKIHLNCILLGQGQFYQVILGRIRIRCFFEVRNRSRFFLGDTIRLHIWLFFSRRPDPGKPNPDPEPLTIYLIYKQQGVDLKGKGHHFLIMILYMNSLTSIFFSPYLNYSNV